MAGHRSSIGNASRLAGLDADLVRRALQNIESQLGLAIDRTRLSAEPIPLIAVGGGSILMPERLAGLEVIRPPYFAAANAIGAAIAQTSGEVDRIYSLESMTREAALAAAETDARAQAVASGALEPSIIVTEREDVPLAYLRGNATRVRVKVIGDLRSRRAMKAMRALTVLGYRGSRDRDRHPRHGGRWESLHRQAAGARGAQARAAYPSDRSR